MFNLLEKISELKKKFSGSKADYQDLKTIDNWLDRAKQLFLLKSLKDHDGIKYVLEIFQSEINKINEQLVKADSKTLPDYDRDRLLDRKDLAQKYLNLFVPVDSELEKLEEKIDEEINNNQYA